MTTSPTCPGCGADITGDPSRSWCEGCIATVTDIMRTLTARHGEAMARYWAAKAAAQAASNECTAIERAASLCAPKTTTDGP